jgi:hypothetical protein
MPVEAPRQLDLSIPVRKTGEAVRPTFLAPQLEGPRKPSSLAEQETCIRLLHLQNALHKRNLGETQTMLGKDGYVHTVIMSGSRVLHLVIDGNLSDQNSILLKNMETVYHSTIVAEMNAGFPPQKRNVSTDHRRHSPLEKVVELDRESIGRGIIEINKLTEHVMDVLQPTWNIHVPPQQPVVREGRFSSLLRHSQERVGLMAAKLTRSTRQERTSS